MTASLEDQITIETCVPEGVQVVHCQRHAPPLLLKLNQGKQQQAEALDLIAQTQAQLDGAQLVSSSPEPWAMTVS